MQDNKLCKQLNKRVMAKSITRFRAYQLNSTGSSYSYAVDDYFVLIEARYNESNKASIREEMMNCGCQFITKLHITSWDIDHCDPNELENLLRELLPSVIEMPGYPAETEHARRSKYLLDQYVKNKSYASSTEFTPIVISGLSFAEERKYTDILYNPYGIDEQIPNNNSTVKLFRRGRFTVLSLGDCEDTHIGARIMNDKIAPNETDVMIVAHHGSDKSLTTPDFLAKVNPKIGVCTSNFDNKYEHPSPKVRAMFNDKKIPLYTTKRGDVIIVCGEDNIVKAYNLVHNNTTIESMLQFCPKCIIN